MTKKNSETLEILSHWQNKVPNDRMAHLVRDVARAYTRALQMRLEAYGIPFGHWAFLRILWEGDGINQTDLSLRAGVMQSTTAVTIRGMEDKGIVQRKKLNGNKKNTYVFLTRRGVALKAKLIPLAEKTNENSQRGIDRKDVQVARQVLLQILENISSDDVTSSHTK